MTDNIIRFELEDQLIVEGVNCKGYGVLPKYVMLDPDLTIDAKTIYAYFCSFSGNGSTSFPGRDKILVDLPMSKDAYYKHLHMLTDQGYITIEQEHKKGGRGDGFARNIYTLVSNPKKFQDKPEDTKHNQAYSRIRFSGLKAAGFGMIPKAVMIDERLQVKAKGIYAYFCGFAGSGNNAFPKLEKILYHLQITKNTYYKFYKMLLDLNYITVIQRHIDGRLSVNDYYLNDNPNAANATKKAVVVAESQVPKIQDTQSQIPKIQDTQKQDTKIQDTQKQDTNINSLTNNNVNIINPSIKQAAELQPAEPEQIERLSDEEIEDIVYDELFDGKCLPYWYKTDQKRMTAAIHFMTDWNIYYPSGYKNKFEQSVYNLFNEALIEMCCSETLMKLRGATVSYANVIDKINQMAKFESTYIDISSFMESAISDFSGAARERAIKNPLQYMKSCIWTAMLTGDIGLYSDLARNGYM